jgi:hypothetical protein
VKSPLFVVILEEGFEAGFIYRKHPLFQEFYPLFVDIDTVDSVAYLCQTSTGCQTDISGSYYTDFHVSISLDRKEANANQVALAF